MKIKLLYITLCLPIYNYAECNHKIVDRHPALACVEVTNSSDRNLFVTGSPGFSLLPNNSEETMLSPGAGNLVRITPNPRAYNDKDLTCRFKIKAAKENKISIKYHKDYYEVFPAIFSSACNYD